MKKLLIALCFGIASTTTNAAPVINMTHPAPSVYNNQYDIGYHNGKRDAYNNVARTFVAIGIISLAAVIIYHAGTETRWTTTQNGVAYRF